MGRQVRIGGLSAILVASALVSSWVMAQEVMKLHVDFKGTDDTKDEIRGIKEQLVSAMWDRVGFWDFQVAGGDELPRVEVTLMEGSGSTTETGRREATRWTMRMDVVQDDQLQVWSDDFRLPGESLSTKPLPKTGEWAAALGDFLRDKLRDGSEARKRLRGELFKWVPLARSMSRRDGDLKYAVLPLVWNRYGSLGTSEFRIQSTVTERGSAGAGGGVRRKVSLYSRGLGVPRKWQGPPEFDGIPVEHRWFKRAGENQAVGLPEEWLRELAAELVFVSELDMMGKMAVGSPGTMNSLTELSGMEAAPEEVKP